MEPNEAVGIVEGWLTDVQNSGATTVAIAVLQRDLARLKQEVGASVEDYKLNHQGRIAEFQAQALRRSDLTRGLLDSGREALNALVLVNGGAAVALLGVLGAIVGRPSAAANSEQLALPLLLFGLGVLLGVVGFGMRYISWAALDAAKNRLAIATTWIAAILVVVGYVSYGFGVYQAYAHFHAAFAA